MLTFVAEYMASDKIEGILPIFAPKECVFEFLPEDYVVQHQSNGFGHPRRI